MEFHCEINDDGAVITLSDKGFLGREKPSLPVSEWQQHSKINEATSILFTAEEEEEGCRRTPDGMGFLLSHEFCSKLSEFQAQSLNLPVILPFALKINTRNSIGSENFKISWDVLRDHQPTRMQKQGAFIHSQSDTTYRLPHELFAIMECIDDFNASDTTDYDTRIAFIGELKSLLPESPEKDIDFEGELKSIKIYHAAAFSLQIDNEMNFHPVLFNKAIKQKAIESDELVEEDEHLLNDDEQKNFIDSFMKRDTSKPSYVVGDGAYVFIDKSLRGAFKTVHKVAKSSREERQEFIKSPQKFLKENMEGTQKNLDDMGYELRLTDIDNLFIETHQFSDRVTALGIWKEPELPWLQREPNEWKDDHYYFHIQEQSVSIHKDDLESVVKDMQKAIEEGAKEINIGTCKITPEPEFLNILENLLPQKPDTPGKSREKEKPPGKVKNMIVLLTKENFETFEYNRSLTPRSESLDNKLPNCLNADIKLKEHQEIGLSWLIEAYNRGYPGVLMADDMGLGKTLQALAFLALMVEANKTETGGPILIVAPVGLLKNWEQEHKKHLSNRGLGVFAKLYGSGLREYKEVQGKDIYLGHSTLDTGKLQLCDWILTTYETLRDYQASFGKMKFSCVVFDELQKAKNPRSTISHAVKTLNLGEYDSGRHGFAIGLTGTPVENRLADLWVIMDILSPGRLGTLRDFVKSYPESDIEKLKALSDKLLKPLQNDPPPVLRRLKSELKDVTLPQKILIPATESTQLMPDTQKNAYSDVYNKLNSGQLIMLKALHQFRSVSLHPNSPHQVEAGKDADYIAMSARFDTTFKILDEIKARDEKVLLFLESRDMQPLMASMIQARYGLQRYPLIINGAISGDSRQNRVNEFQNSPAGFDVMIISPKAGGVGITLTAANNVIHLERWWNPAVEDQCTDRAYRIGQENTVRVYTPIAKHSDYGDKSFDCVLDRLLDTKRQLSKEIFIPTVIRSAEFSGQFSESGTPPEQTLEDIDCFESGEDFEQYIITQLQKAGLSAKRTPRSHDKGADIIVENSRTGQSGIIQCKHRSSGEKTVSKGAVEEVLNAVEYYPIEAPALFVASNAGQAAYSCETLARKNGVVLILRDDLLGVAKIIREKLS